MEDAADVPIFEPGPGEIRLWPDIRVTGLFDAQVDADAVIDAVIEALGADVVGSCDIAILEDQVWERTWLDSFKPMQFGDRLWIVPTEYEAPDPGAVNIQLDPGLAFGTGTHATTALCLRWLDRNLQQKSAVLDFGCGSGILAIAAAKLGAESIVGVDIDPQALLATRENAMANQVGDKIAVVLSEQYLPKTYDLILANILAQPLIEHAEKFGQWSRRGGQIVLSGILEAQAKEVADAFAPYFIVDAPQIEDGWVMLSGRRKE